ncbi:MULTISPECIES: TonB-dependent receptor [unclassified Microbulbifer]|uniref:TonB-dependent receptor n=1 Tax=unclassified Microbulbifer TaxID=2619833 RepID=UPI0027E49959|nr:MULTISPECIES: TonB-dependent receptor [unclassified Microbulbifer]
MLKRNKLALSISAAMLSGGLVSPLALAQSGEALEEVTVTGIRGSLQDALSTKRDSYAIVDAISAEDIGKFPDKNVAESLQRVPGVTIQRQFGEGAAVSIRGAGNDLTLTTLNGQSVASTGWFVLEPAKRSFNYELLPSELVGDIKVYKSAQADLAEGGVGGTVEINTRKPLDLDSMTLHGSLEGSYQSDSSEVDPQTSGLASWKNDSETFGVLVSAVSQERSLQRQGNEAFWEWGAGPVAFEQERKRSAVTATFQYQPNDRLDIVFNAIDMKMEADNTNYALWLTQGNCGWCADENGDPITVDPADQINGTTARGPIAVAYYQARPREATMSSDVYDLSVDYSGDGYVLSFQAGRTTSSGGTDFEMVLDDGSGGTPVDGTYDFFGGQSWDLGSFDMSSYDPGSLAMGTGANYNATPKTDDETYFQSDLEFDVEFGAINAIKAGLKWSDHNTSSRKYTYLLSSSFDPAIPTAEVLDGTIDAGSYEIPKIDADAAKDWARSATIGKEEDLGSYSEVDETNSAVYVMATFGSDNVRGNFGVRYVTTDASSIYYLQDADGNYLKEDIDGDYSEFLPSFNLAMDLSDDVILRTSAARVMARPQYVDMYVNPQVSGTDDDLADNQFWVIGNVDLDPFIANQFDIGLEWYFTEGSLLSGAVFYKDVKNFVTYSNTDATAVEIPFAGALRPEEEAAGWTVQVKDNNNDATIQGFELSYQQDFGNGFGTILNYTNTDTETNPDTYTDGRTVLSDSSEHVYNLTGYYENDLFSVRLAYNWRSEYMIRETGSYGNRLHDDFGTLDLSALWHVTDNIDVKLNATNLLEEDATQYGNNAEITPGSGFTSGFPLYEYEYARRIDLGVSARF